MLATRTNITEEKLVLSSPFLTCNLNKSKKILVNFLTKPDKVSVKTGLLHEKNRNIETLAIFFSGALPVS
jgi:hypothetical protein